MASARLLVIEHETGTEAGRLADWLGAAGVESHVVRAQNGADVPGSPQGFDGLLVLGGSMSAHDDAAYPWLAPTKRLIAATVGAGVPFVGICLGHQLAALALGGRTGPNPGGSLRGMHPVVLTPAGTRDPLLGPCAGAPAVHFNDDVVLEPPPGARILATLPDGRIQALAFGPLAWGVQFHPETSPQDLARWFTSDTRTDASRAAELVREAYAADESAVAAWAGFARRFADVLAS